jgi:hypothetical protein
MSSRDEAEVWYYLARARSLGMYVTRTDDERDLLAQIQYRFRGPSGEPEGKPLSELEPLTDQQFETVRSALVTQFAPLREAYLRGMIVARNDEQREVLTELQRLLGRTRDS